MKKLIAICAALLALTLLAACGKKTITVEKAQQIALESVGLKTAHHVHVDVEQYENEACFVVHISEGEQEFYVYVSQTGQVLHTDK